MDVMRFVRSVRPAGPPPVALASGQRQRHHQQPSRAAMHMPPLRLWPVGVGGGGGGGEERPGTVSGAIRGEEAKSQHVGEGEKGLPEGEAEADEERKQGNWVWVLQHMLWVQPQWVEAAGAEAAGAVSGDGGQEAVSSEGRVDDEGCVSCGGGGEEEGCCVLGEDDDEIDGQVFDRDTFSKLLRKVSLGEAKEYSKMSYLCNIAYMIPKMKPKCLRRYNLLFVTSSVQEKARAGLDQKQQEHKNEKDESPDKKSEVVKNAEPESNEEKPFCAYHVMSSAASYLHSRAMAVIPFGSRSGKGKNDPTFMAITVNGESGEGLSLDEASFVSATDSVTSMVATKEETRQAVADDVNSSRSCPSEWFICDDDEGSARYFVVQGSESIASWQANLLFEPVKFEGLDVHVHRGIYEAANGMYHQMLPYVKSHLKSCGESAALRFTGHSLGGSLALLVNLMLLMRGAVPASSLSPVVTFGAPCIMCGGDNLLRKLGLPRNHVQSITMHRDIVPRLFSCNYPDHVANILKLANGNFRRNPCLTNQKLLYAPMGEVFILQPDKRLSPHHHLLPPDSGIYHLSDMPSGASLRQLRSAVSTFLNSPHPLEILKDGAAYGPKGTVYRDHDVNSYLRSVRAVVRKEARRHGETGQKQRRRLLVWWALDVHDALPSDAGRRTARTHARLLLAKLLVLGAFLSLVVRRM
ncbi:hypothetical protein GUJ93_ZPchr0008g14190 [Zizania palustris]|uniref:Fungal lipase-type domain-containing protein n=1 Tax=Zizania palustris TaxID=103762 RepID=A0A8J5VFD8_ZIZPA|nr:hypothetical protein GUJ93_ZPchr0008g14190 [Zizania palustris]